MKQKSIVETTVKTQDDTHSAKQSRGSLWIQPTRRELLVWTAPVIASISLPVHAQTSVCTTPPVLTPITPAKCAGEIPQGEATLGIFSSDAMVALEIISVTDNAVDPNVMTYSATSGMVTDTNGINVGWKGPSTDGVTCLPEVDVMITVTYTCNNDPMNYTAEFSILGDALADAVP